ncbi:MAG TPA: GNAT family N-acetyltransferase, partial [Longimicrobiales bacterium]|nr:GNAT family N-acetyltransferase [Longimicrobiales bacterium]
MLLPFAAGDLDELHALFTHPDVRRWLLDDEIVSPEWVAAEIAASGERFAAGGLGLWTVRERAGDALVGFVGFRPFFDPPELQLL